MQEKDTIRKILELKGGLTNHAAAVILEDTLLWDAVMYYTDFLDIAEPLQRIWHIRYDSFEVPDGMIWDKNEKDYITLHKPHHGHHHDHHLEHEVGELEDEVKDLKHENEGQEQEITDLEHRDQLQEQEITDLKNQDLVQEQEITNLEHKIETQDLEIHHLEDEVQDLEDKNQEQDQEIFGLKKDIEDIKKEIDDIMNPAVQYHLVLKVGDAKQK